MLFACLGEVRFRFLLDLLELKFRVFSLCFTFLGTFILLLRNLEVLLCGLELRDVFALRLLGYVSHLIEMRLGLVAVLLHLLMVDRSFIVPYPFRLAG